MSFELAPRFYLSAREIMGCRYADTHWALLVDSEDQRCIGYFEYGQLMTPASQSFSVNWTATAGTKELDVGLGKLPYYFIQLTERSPAAFRLGSAALGCWWRATSRELAAKQASGLTSNCVYGDEYFVYPPRPWAATLQAWRDQRCRLERRQSIATVDLLWQQIEQFARKPDRVDAATIDLTDPATGALHDEIIAPLRQQIPASCRAEFFQLVGADLLRFVQQAGPITLGDRSCQVENHVLTSRKTAPVNLSLLTVTTPAEPLVPALPERHGAQPGLAVLTCA